MELNELKNICKPPCTVTRATVRTARSENYLGIGINKTGLTLYFDEIVQHSRVIIGYDSSNFLVDFRSSIGLWFGISVLGKLSIIMEFS